MRASQLLILWHRYILNDMRGTYSISVKQIEGFFDFLLLFLGEFVSGFASWFEGGLFFLEG